MELKDLRSSMFGFKKDDVCEYIAELNSTFSKQLAEQKDEAEESIVNLSSKNEELHAEIAKLQTQLEVLNREIEEKDKEIQKLKSDIDALQNGPSSSQQYENVVEILLEAKEFSNHLHEKAVAENEAFRRQNRRRNEIENEKIDIYGKCVEKIKDTITETLNSMKTQISKIDKQISYLRKGKDEEDDHEE